MLKAGTPAPDVDITTHTGYHGKISHYWSQGPLILFFYPKDGTTICTKEACSLQESLSVFNTMSATVLGSSTDSVDSHKKFAASQGLEFPLIADTNAAVAKAYESYRSLLRISKRITYVISQEGLIVGSLHSELSASAHVEGALKLLRAES